MMPEGRKNPRQFQCTDAVWNTVRRMAEEQEKGVDELISDALVAYAQLAGYQTGVSVEEDGPVTPPPTRPLPPPGAPLNAMMHQVQAPQPAPPPQLHHPPHMGTDGATPGSGSAAPPLYLVFD